MFLVIWLQKLHFSKPIISSTFLMTLSREGRKERKGESDTRAFFTVELLVEFKLDTGIFTECKDFYICNDDS